MAISYVYFILLKLKNIKTFFFKMVLLPVSTGSVQIKFPVLCPKREFYLLCKSQSSIFTQYWEKLCTKSLFKPLYTSINDERNDVISYFFFQIKEMLSKHIISVNLKQSMKQFLKYLCWITNKTELEQNALQRVGFPLMYK